MKKINIEESTFFVSFLCKLNKNDYFCSQKSVSPEETEFLLNRGVSVFKSLMFRVDKKLFCVAFLLYNLYICILIQYYQ